MADSDPRKQAPDAATDLGHQCTGAGGHGSDDALHLHRDLLERLQRPAADNDTDLLAQIDAECVQLRPQW
ncbi:MULTISPECIES: hypothetical protein [unclassified Streptomyces]|uniref:hypothetical protein n=1 Tax=unclassified Streptomyces TaxID=2593676 RepID=UPI00224FE85B|nr:MULTISPECIES: hypothetical protein [unclassified Streptomyces]MCX4549795.1 hypothetical protein [Streptomyces sp. NBC_01500]WSC21319.1 hypothetical protein OIE60_17420 [Streptomyces sp. NBC_01766]